MKSLPKLPRMSRIFQNLIRFFCVSSEIPVPALKNLTQWLDVFPTERVSLSCGMDSTSAWKYTWYRDGSKLPGNDHTVALDSDGTILNIGSASAEHSGEYSCSGTLKSRPVHSNRSSTLTLRVYGEVLLSVCRF